MLTSNGTLGIVLIGQNRRVFNELYKICGSLVPAFWRQIEQQVPELLAANSLQLSRTAA